ncbi:MAG: helix-turn-helix domain-containing protein [Bacteroidales bacterium]
MEKKFNNQKLPKSLSDFFTSDTYGGAQKELKEVNAILGQFNKHIRDKSIDRVKTLTKEGKSKKVISTELGISLSTVYRYCKK